MLYLYNVKLQVTSSSLFSASNWLGPWKKRPIPPIPAKAYKISAASDFFPLNRSRLTASLFWGRWLVWRRKVCTWKTGRTETLARRFHNFHPRCFLAPANFAAIAKSESESESIISIHNKVNLSPESESIISIHNKMSLSPESESEIRPLLATTSQDALLK